MRRRRRVVKKEEEVDSADQLVNHKSSAYTL